MIFWLKEQGVVFIEQPMPKTAYADTAWLTQRSPLPVIADEAFQTVADLEKVNGVYSGINVKLMKCGGYAGSLYHNENGQGAWYEGHDRVYD